MSIYVKKLTKAFDGKRIFEDFSLTFDDDSVYIIQGYSGAGKTTLLRLIAGLDKDFSGEILGAGLDKCAFMFQEYRLFPTVSALENVLLCGPSDEQSKKLAIDLLIKLGLTEEDLGLLPEELSGGMKQRVSFARTVYSNKPVLLLDEPTKELDYDSKKRMLELLREVSVGKTVLIVSHEDLREFLPDAKIINI